MRQLVYNAVTCTECLDTIVSYHRHDYKTCRCENKAMVDGGTDYVRYGGKDMKKVVHHAVYDDEDFEKVRQYATRGSRGINGTMKLTYIPIKDLDDDYLKAILDYGGVDWYLNLIKKEIKYRENEVRLNNK